jgi:hypothetical protein
MRLRGQAPLWRSVTLLYGLDANVAAAGRSFKHLSTIGLNRT